MSRNVAKDFDDYADRFPEKTQQVLRKMRLTVKKAAPEAKESISYGMPTFILGRNRVYFAAYKNHIGFYPGGAIAPFKEDLSAYKSTKGGVQFPINEPLPTALVSRIVKARMKQSETKKRKSSPQMNSGVGTESYC